MGKINASLTLIMFLSSISQVFYLTVSMIWEILQLPVKYVKKFHLKILNFGFLFSHLISTSSIWIYSYRLCKMDFKLPQNHVSHNSQTHLNLKCNTNLCVESTIIDTKVYIKMQLKNLFFTIPGKKISNSN